MKKIYFLLFMMFLFFGVKGQVNYGQNFGGYVIYNGHVGCQIFDCFSFGGVIEFNADSQYVKNVTIFGNSTLEMSACTHDTVRNTILGYSCKLISACHITDGVEVLNGQYQYSGAFWNYNHDLIVDLSAADKVISCSYDGYHTAAGDETKKMFVSNEINSIDSLGGYVKITPGNIRLYNGVTFPIENAIAYSFYNGDLLFTDAAHDTTEVLHGFPNHHGGKPTFGKVKLGSDVSGTLPFASVASLGSMAKADSVSFHGNGNIVTTGAITTYAGFSTSGLGFTPIIYELDTINVGADLSIDVPGTDAHNSIYKVSLYVSTHTADAAAGILSATFTYLAIGGTPKVFYGNTILASADDDNIFEAGGYTGNVFYIKHYGVHYGAKLNIVTANSGIYGSATYDLRMIVELVKQD